MSNTILTALVVCLVVDSFVAWLRRREMARQIDGLYTRVYRLQSDELETNMRLRKLEGDS